MGERANGAVSIVRCFVFFVLSFAPVEAAAQHYPILHVPNSPPQVYAILQDHSSRLWVGTSNGLFCFDGEQFYSIQSLGFPREKIITLAEDGDGGIWAGTQIDDPARPTSPGGLYRYFRGQVAKMRAGNVLSVVNVAPDVMVASFASATRPRFGDLIRFNAKGTGWASAILQPKAARYLSVDHGGSILYPCPGAICKLSRQAVIDGLLPRDPRIVDIEYDPTHSGIRGPSSPERVLHDRLDRMWLRSEIAAAVRVPGSPVFRPLDELNGKTDALSVLVEAPDGSVLMLGDLEIGAPGAFHTARGRNGLPPNPGAAIIARDGTIWLGAEDGLYRFMYPFRLEYWDAQDGVEAPYAILRKGARVYAANEGIFELDQNHRFWNPLPNADKLGTVVNLLDGKGDTFYTASLIRGASLMNTRGDVLKQTPYGPGGASLAKDNAGSIWMAGSGLSRIVSSGGALKYGAGVAGRGPDLDVKFDPIHNSIWECHSQEVIQGTPGASRHFTTQNGLVKDTCQTIAITKSGDAWVGYSVAAAITLIKDAYSASPSFRTFRSDSTGNMHVQFMDIDERGWLWRGSDHLDFVATPEAAEKGEWLPLGESDGIPTPGGNQNAFYNDPDGSLWFASGNTIVHFRPDDRFATTFPSPEVSISGFSEGQSSPSLADAKARFHSASDLTAHIASLQFDRRNAMHVRYRLLPRQTAWRESDGFNIPLGRLSWGRHTLQIQARLSSGEWSRVSEQPFAILTPLWAAWPALGAYAISAGLLAFGGARWSRKSRARLQKAFPEIAEWRLAALSPELTGIEGSIIDERFEVGRVIARGGFAAVVEAADLENNRRRCALKIFRQELNDREWMTRRFDQEVAALGAVRHPNVVRIYGSGALPSGALYLAMEFVEGGTLRDLLELGALPVGRVAPYVRQLGSALDAIHQAGICHRDVKPENLMIRTGAPDSEELVLIDFSIAIVKDPDETLHGLSRAAGTIYYMAPEQALGYAEPSTDVYSMAKVTLEMLTGKKLSQLLPDAAMDLPVRVRELLHTLPVYLSPGSIEMIARALEFDPSRRPSAPGSFAEMIAFDLTAGVSGTLTP